MALSTIDTSSISGLGYGFKNRIINGGMQVWQRGTSFSSPGNIVYTADRWVLGIGGSNPASVTQVAGPTGFEFALRVTGAAGNSTVQINQRIESNNTADLVGHPVTIQANIQVSSAQTVGWALFHCNTKDSSALTSIASGTWSATTTAQTLTATIAALPAAVANGMMLLISPNNGAAFTSGTITVTGVQLEKGTVATSFDYRPYGTELQLCQRYYERRTVGSTNNERLGTTGLSNGSSGAQIPIQHLVQKRASPSSVNVGNLSSTSTYDGTGSGTPTSWSLDNTGIFITNIQISGISTVLGRAIHWTWNNVTPLPFVEINSELT
jgi:hypothetical protein